MRDFPAASTTSMSLRISRPKRLHWCCVILRGSLLTRVLMCLGRGDTVGQYSWHDRLQIHDSGSLTFVSSSERENEKPAAQKRLGMGVSAHLARREAFRRSMPSGPKWLVRSSVGLSSAGTCASGPWPCTPKKPYCVHTTEQGQANVMRSSKRPFQLVFHCILPSLKLMTKMPGWVSGNSGAPRSLGGRWRAQACSQGAHSLCRAATGSGPHPSLG